MKVLIVHPQMSYYGGAELLVVKLSNYLLEKGIENHLLTLNISEDAQKELKAKTIIPSNDVKISSKGFETTADLIKGIRVLRKELKKIYKNYDVINFHNFPATWSLWPRKKPTVWMLNEPPNLWSQPKAGFILKQMNKLRNKIDKTFVNSISIVCVSDEFNKKRAKERYNKEARIVNYGIDYDFFSKGNKKDAIKKYSLKNKFVIIQSGVLSEQKNQIESIKAIEKLRGKIKNILLVLAGKPDEEYEKKLKDYIKEKSLENQVLFTGNLKREDLRDLYAASNVALFPIKSQGGWLAPFETLSALVPLIVSEEFTGSSVVKENKLGIATNNYEEAILKLYNNKSKIKNQTKKQSLWIKNNLSWPAFGNKLIKAYEDALSSRS